MDCTPRIIDTAAFARAMGMSHTSFIRSYRDELPPPNFIGAGSKRDPDDGRPYWTEETGAQWMSERGKTYDRRRALRP